MLSLALFTTSAVIAVAGVTAFYAGRITAVQGSGIAAVACLPAVAAAAVEGATTVASALAALGAVNAWLWWSGGGGDGTRRRLKAWASQFRGVRRTAPQSA